MTAGQDAMAAQPDSIVRARCGCGRKLRIRNAAAGAQITCPKCGRIIAVTAADLQAGEIQGDFLFVTADPDARPAAELLEAIPVSRAADVRLAVAGSVPGITDKVRYAQEDSALIGAIRGGGGARSGLPGFFGLHAAPIVAAQRSFPADLLASFYFAGISANAWNIVFTAGGMCVLAALGWFLPAAWFIALVPLHVAIAIYAMHFNFLVFETTVGGEDLVPWYETNWDLWDDAVVPVWRIGVISALCSLPAMLLVAFVRPANAAEWSAAAVLLVAGWLLWPIGVMTITVGNSILCLRPDVLVRSITRIGPRYLLAYGLVILLILGWGAFLMVRPRTGVPGLDLGLLMLLTLAAPLVNLYLGYVLFRTLGLLYRHFQQRLPWRA